MDPEHERSQVAARSDGERRKRLSDVAWAYEIGRRVGHAEALRPGPQARPSSIRGDRRD